MSVLRLDQETKDFLKKLKEKDGGRDKDVVDYFNALEQLYKDTLKESTADDAQEECERFDLLRRLKNSPYNADHAEAQSQRKLSLWMYKLSMTWDKIAGLRHSKIQDKRKHLFFLTYYREKTYLREEGYTSHIFNQYNEPDKRLVSLSLTKDTPPKDYRLLLHEMGHFIGFRNRIRRKDLLTNLIFDAVWGRIYKLCLNRYDGVPDEEPPQLYNDSILPLENLRRAYCEKLFECCFHVFRKVNEHIKNIVPDPSDDTALGVNDFMYFSKEFTKELLPWIDNILMNDIFWKEICEQTGLDMITKKTYQDIYGAVQTVLRDHKAKMKPEIIQMLDCIEEPTADCFMIAICGMGLKEYLNLILEKAYDFWFNNQSEEKTPEKFCEFMASPDHRIRVLAVCFSLDAEEKDFLSPQGWIFSTKGECIRKARKMLADMYGEMIEHDPTEARIFEDVSDPQDPNNASLKRFAQNILNPQARISAYIYNLMLEYKSALNLDFPEQPLPSTIAAELTRNNGNQELAEKKNEDALRLEYEELLKLREELKKIIQ